MSRSADRGKRSLMAHRTASSTPRQSADRGKSPTDQGKSSERQRPKEVVERGKRLLSDQRTDSSTLQQSVDRGRSPMDHVSMLHSSGQQDPISHMDLMEMFRDVDLVHSKNVHEVVEKAKAKLKEEALLLLFSQPPTDETRAKFESLMFKAKCLDRYFTPHTTGEGHAGTTEHETPSATDYVPLSSEQSGTQVEASQREHEGTVPSNGRCTLDRVDQDQGVDAEECSQIDSSGDPFCTQLPNESTQNEENGGQPNIEVDVDQHPEGLPVQVEAARHEDQTHDIHVAQPPDPGTLQQPRPRREHMTRQTRAQAATEARRTTKQVVEGDVTIREYMDRRKRQKK